MAKIQDIRGRTPRSNGTRSLSQIKHIVRHHSATTAGNFDTFWQYWNGTRGWGTGGYHEIILRDGTVQLCYDPEEITNGVANYNTFCYHICLVGKGSFTDEQEKVWDERVAYNMNRLNVPVNEVKGHQEMPNSNTSCPGIDMDAVRQRIRDGGAATGTYTVKSGDTLWGIATSNNMTVQQLKNLNDLKSDVIHPGDELKLSTGGNSTNSKPQASLAVDGLWGPITTSALQTHLGTIVDGVISGQYNNNTTKAIPSANYGPPFTGSNVIRALQRLIGAKVDGFIGPETVRSLQRYLGTPVDGVISKPSLMVKALQRRLNAGNL